MGWAAADDNPRLESPQQRSSADGRAETPASAVVREREDRRQLLAQLAPQPWLGRPRRARRLRGERAPSPVRPNEQAVAVVERPEARAAFYVDAIRVVARGWRCGREDSHLPAQAREVLGDTSPPQAAYDAIGPEMVADHEQPARIALHRHTVTCPVRRCARLRSGHAMGREIPDSGAHHRRLSHDNPNALRLECVVSKSKATVAAAPLLLNGRRFRDPLLRGRNARCCHT